MLVLVLLCALVLPSQGSKFVDKELEQLADYYRSFSRDDDSSFLGEGLFDTLWFPQVPKQSDRGYKWSRQAKAQPDECWTAIDQPVQQGPCNANSNPAAKNKTNQGYAWSAVKVGDNLFWGTVANYLCLAGSQLVQALGNTGPTVNDDVVCYNQPGANGIPLDYRPPQIFVRNENGAPGSEVRISDGVPPQAQPLLQSTLGIRAAGAANGVAVFGGASLTGTSLNLFAFASQPLRNPQTGAIIPLGTFLGAVSLTAFNDFRKFTTIAGSTYLALFGASGFGYLVRFSPASPFAPFAPGALGVVAKLQGNPAEITVYDEDQVLIATWAMPSTLGPLPGKLILSPPINSLQVVADATNATAVALVPFTAGFTTVWRADSYDPDPVTGLTLGASSIAQASDGWFYWGTFQFPPQPLGYFNQTYQPNITAIVLLKTLLGTLRPTAIFRGKGFDTATPEIELLYGERYLPVYDGVTKKWTAKANKLGVTPKYGRSGYGVFTNVYTWSANAYKGDVLLGTFDESYVFASQIQSLIPTNDDPYRINEIFGWQSINFGGDLYTFESGKRHPFNPYNPAKWITLSGLDNPVNYGLRNIVNDPNDPLEDRWITTANPFNVNPAGGWEVYRLGNGN